MSSTTLEFILALLSCIAAFFKNRNLFFKFKYGDKTEFTVDLNEESEEEKQEEKQEENEEKQEEKQEEKNEIIK